MLKRIQNCDVITHGDGDGTIAAAIAKKNGATGKLIVTQPFLLHKLTDDLASPTVILDMAVDNKTPQATLDWAWRNAANITLWLDHHAGGEALAEILGERFVFDPSAPSCPELMVRNGFEAPEEWIAAANASDRPADFPPTPLSQRYNAAFKVALVKLAAGDRKAVAAVQTAFIDELLSGEKSPLVDEYAASYPELLRTTKEAAEGFREIAPGVVMTTVTHQAAADITTLLFAGYKLAGVAAVQTRSAEDGSEISIVGTNARDLNLVESFNLGSGNPSRVVLSGGTHAEQLARIREALG